MGYLIYTFCFELFCKNIFVFLMVMSNLELTFTSTQLLIHPARTTMSDVTILPINKYLLNINHGLPQDYWLAVATAEAQKIR